MDFHHNATLARRKGNFGTPAKSKTEGCLLQQQADATDFTIKVRSIDIKASRE
jgi:hypothetical protein